MIKSAGSNISCSGAVRKSPTSLSLIFPSEKWGGLKDSWDGLRDRVLLHRPGAL